jgi:DNA-binding NarL/FixJ family response regulator
MKVILIGSAEERARMRVSFDGAIDIVGEFPTLESAEAARIPADGILLPPRVRPKRNTTYAVEPVDEAFHEPLTPREIEVLELLAEGLPNRAIADRLGISDQTVKFHVASIAGKLGAANRTDAVRRAVRRGLITF